MKGLTAAALALVSAGTAVALVSFAAGTAAVAPAAHGKPPPLSHPRSCAAPGARVLAHSASIRVYETRPRSAGEPRAIQACLSGHRGHMTLLAPTRLNSRTSLSDFELAGHVAAYLESQFGVDTGTTKLVVVDVAARRVLHSIAAGSYAVSGLRFREAVERFLVTSRGSLAWTATREDHRSPVVVSVNAASREGPPALLDSGEAIDAGSLTLAGGTLSWRDAGSERTAPMP